MALNFIPTELPGVIVIEPNIFRDPRGYFLETYHQKKYAEGGIHTPFVQDNFSSSAKNTLRGLHYQKKCPQAKLVMCLSGEIFDVVVDIRNTSPTFKKWMGVSLSGENKKQIYVPEGFAHGFCVLSETATVLYKCSDFYKPEDEGGLLWSDPEIGIDWPVQTPVLSKKDEKNISISEIE